ncbi:MAG: hypothetical protein IPM32_10835 [Ignavibacteriae bacterium]|nr:hypothetical protein [Ignavibacteriota bacterium]
MGKTVAIKILKTFLLIVAISIIDFSVQYIHDNILGGGIAIKFSEKTSGIGSVPLESKYRFNQLTVKDLRRFFSIDNKRTSVELTIVKGFAIKHNTFVGKGSMFYRLK